MTDVGGENGGAKSAKKGRPRQRKRRGRPKLHEPGPGEKNSAPTLSRLLATRVLERVERTQAYADIALHHALAQSGLSAADRALTTELVYGTLRWRGRLDFFLSHFVNKDLSSLEPLVATTLRLGAYQLLFTDRIPASAAVDQSVRCIRAAGSDRATGLVNAVLRRLAREWQTVLPPRVDEDPVGHLVHALSLPEWMAKRLLSIYESEPAAAFAKACNHAPPLTIRVNRLRSNRDDYFAMVTEKYPQARPCALAPDGINLGHIGDPGLDPSFREGFYSIQDEASQLVVELLDPQPGEFILDTCAAPGTKSTAIGERLGEQGSILALDRNAKRLNLVAQAARRLELVTVHTLQRDATRPLTDLEIPGKPVASDEPPLFDRVLVDAPCSGIGTLRRNPDARWRLREDDSSDLCKIQKNLLIRAAAVLRRGGSLVYSTCTVFPEENEETVQHFLEQNPNFRQVPRDELPESLAAVLDPAGSLRCTPHQHGTDGFFAVRLERIE
jgi:16S rRNA (cytosine967-C5)-methyltransferase